MFHRKLCFSSCERFPEGVLGSESQNELDRVGASNLRHLPSSEKEYDKNKMVIPINWAIESLRALRQVQCSLKIGNAPWINFNKKCILDKN